MILALLLALADDEVTYTKHVAPILFKHCASCHRPGEIGPFPLLTYADASKRAKFLKEITSDGRMPPWKAAPQDHAFRDERRLTDEEKRTIARWADGGSKEGDAKDLPAPPKFPEGWQLGTPDVVLKMAKPFTVPATGRDVYRCFVIPIPTDADRTVAAVEFRPGNPKVVHHAIFYTDALGQGRKKDPDGSGYASYGGPGILPTGGLGAWAPGATPRFFPDGMGLYLRKGSDLVLQVHYHPSGKEEPDQSQVGVYFTKKPAEKVVTGIAIASRTLNIPAGAKEHRVSAQSEPLPVDANAVAVAPHMHMIGRKMKVTAALPEGGSLQLIDVQDWDFNWQGAYQFEKSVRLPKGTVIKVEAVYDNSKDNPQNPSDPPKPVRWGEQTTDEMCLLGVQVVADSAADLRQIAAMRSARLGGAIFGGSPALDPKAFEDGFPIPEALKGALGRYDKNQDGKIDSEEIDAMPPALRDRIRPLVPKKDEKK
jgi:hypothetical protein